LVEHQLWELAVAGSNPVAPTISFSHLAFRIYSQIIPSFLHPRTLANIFFPAQIATCFFTPPFWRNLIFFNGTGHFCAFHRSKIPLGIAAA
jgi:hypothetical protein